MSLDLVPRRGVFEFLMKGLGVAVPAIAIIYLWVGFVDGLTGSAESRDMNAAYNLAKEGAVVLGTTWREGNVKVFHLRTLNSGMLYSPVVDIGESPDGRQWDLLQPFDRVYFEQSKYMHDIGKGYLYTGELDIVRIQRPEYKEVQTPFSTHMTYIPHMKK